MATKPTRRGHNEGTIRQRADGTWEARLSLPNGKRKSLYGKTRNEVRDKMRAAMRDLERGVDLSVSSQKVSDFLISWLDTVVRPNKAPKTTASYEEVVRLHLIPTIGSHRLDRLTPQHVAAMLKAKQDAGLSARRVHHIRAVLRNALNQAVRWDLVARNVASLVEPPRQTATEVEPFTVAEARTLLRTAQGDRLEAAYRVALTLGLREGELLGLRWSDIDLVARQLRVRQAVQRIGGKLILKEPKTEKSRRTLALPASVIAALDAHKARQEVERQFAGERWQEHGLVFPSTVGTPTDPRNLIRSWHRLQERARVPRKPFHTCRHTAASLLAADGVPMKVVQEVLGHSLLSTTADIYSHLFQDAFQDAADAMDRALA